MERLKSSAIAKVLAVILAALMLSVTAGSVIAVSALYYSQAYTESADDYVNGMAEQRLASYAYRLLEIYTDYNRHSLTEPDYIGDLINSYDINVYYRLYKNNGELIREDFDSSAITDYHVKYENEQYTLELYSPKNPDSSDTLSILTSLCALGHKMRYALIYICAASVILGIILFVFIMSSAGHRKPGASYGKDIIAADSGTVTSSRFSLSMFDRIPFDLILAVAVIIDVLLWLFVGLAYESYYGYYSLYYGLEIILCIGVTAVVTFLTAIMLLVVLMTMSARIKSGTLIKNNVITMVLLWIFKIITAVMRGICSAISRAYSHIPFFWRSLLIISGLFLFELFTIIIVNEATGFIIVHIILWTFIIYAVCRTAYMMNMIKRGGERLAAGDFDSKIDTKYMRSDFRRHAENLNNVGGGMVIAVEERMKSERFKTELITNVSHDIKTPLTSIINYIDLLKKSDIQGEDAKNYIEVLDRQSARLKKLTEDLVEASKAATGAIKSEPVPCELGVLLTQAVGEYEEKFTAHSLTTVVTKPEYPVTIMADGRHLWRIFDNLMNNVCKYAMPGTRVYIELVNIEGDVAISFKNVSRDELNISGNELMERFVRGDSSRHTEGSGLGLSIARSLAELCGGTLNIYIDGDLYKAVLRFREINA